MANPIEGLLMPGSFLGKVRSVLMVWEALIPLAMDSTVARVVLVGEKKISSVGLEGMMGPLFQDVDI
jgi:hypothetical protein